MLKNWDWDDTGITLVITVVMAIVAFMFTYALSTKKVDGYYIGPPSDNSTCVYAHWQWNADQRAYCSENKDSALDFMARANDALRK